MDPEDEALLAGLQNSPPEEAEPEDLEPLQPEPEAQSQEIEYDPAQVYADANGNEWKPNADTGEWEIVATAEPEVPVAAPVATAQTATEETPTYKPAAPVMTIQGMPQDVRDRLNELAITDPVAAAAETYSYMAARDRQAQAVASYFVEQEAAIAPEFYRVHNASMQAHLATIAPEKRATKEAVQEAAMVAIYNEVRQTGDLRAALLRAAELVAPKPAAKPKPAVPAQPPRILTPSQRTPSASVSPTATRAATAQRSAGTSIGAKFFMEEFGISQDEAQKIVNLNRR